MMAKGLQLLFILTITTFLAGCTTFNSISNKAEDTISRTKVEKTDQAHYAPTNPDAVIITKNNHLKTHYKKIASISVNRYNFVGVKRQKAAISELMQTHAAKLGGNAIINFKYQKNLAVGDIVKTDLHNS